MRFKNILIAVVSAFAVISVPASAGVIGMADLAIKRLVVIDTTTGNPLLAGTINIKKDTRNGSAGSQFNDIEGTGTGIGSKASTATGATVDVGHRCAGPTCAAIAGVYGSPENNLATHVKTPTGNYALGDMYIGGNALSTSVSGAQGLTRADSSVTTADYLGSASATILNSASALTTFTVPTTITAVFVIDFNAFVNAYVATVGNQSGTASAAIGWNLTLSSSDPSFTTLNWTPSELNVGLESSAFNQNKMYEVVSGTIVSDARTFKQNTTYSLVINQSSNSLAALVPEPGSIALLGLGLFALAGVSRRLNAK